MANNDSPATPSTIDQYFVHPIGSSTLSRIKIPAPFYKRFDIEEHGKNTVTLISTQRLGEWKVTREDRTLKDGWQKFAEGSSLQVNDYVIFRHKGNSVFEVTTLGPSGSQINYKNIQSSPSTDQAGDQARSVKKQQQNMEEAGTSKKRKKRATMERMNAGTSKKRKKRGTMERMNAEKPSLAAEATKAYKKTVLGEPNTLYQAVTDSNIGKNSVYIPASFVTMHGLETKESDPVLLTNKEGEIWEATATLCVDGRINIARGWSVFCADNNIESGDCCKFNLIEDKDHIILELAGFTNRD